MQGRLVALAFAAMALHPCVGVAQDSTMDTLRLDAAVDLVRANNPELMAARMRVDAAQARVPQMGALPDLQLMLGLLNRPVDDFGTSQPMTMNTVQLQQRFPWPGKLGFSRDGAEFTAAAAVLDAEEMDRVIVARTKNVYFHLAYLDRALQIMRETRELLRDFREVSTVSYAVGTGLQQDVLQAQVSVASMTEDIVALEQTRLAGAARFNALLGRGATEPVEALVLPTTLAPLVNVDSLMAIAAAHRPGLLAAKRRIDAADAQYRATRRALYPDFTVTLGYGQRPQFVDFLTFTVGVNIPLWAGSRQLPARREMEARRREAEARERNLYNETYATLAESRAEAERARNLAVLYTTSVLPQASAAVESALSAYRVGRVDYTTLVSNQMTVNRYQIERVRLHAAYRQAVAQIEALVGTEFGGTP